MVWPAAGAGPAKLALAVQELGSTRLAPSRRDGAADPKASPLPPAPCLLQTCPTSWVLAGWLLLDEANPLVWGGYDTHSDPKLPATPLLACWLLVGWLVHSFWHHFASFWDHFDIILGPVGIILGPLGTIVGHLGKKLLYGEPMYRI